MALETQLRNARIASSVSATMISLACGTNVSPAAAALRPPGSALPLSISRLVRRGSC